MAIRQISVFLENKQGALEQALGVLADAGVDLRAMAIADTQEFGILRLIAKSHATDAAAAALRAAGYVISLNYVVAVEVPDEPGGLLKVLSLLAAEGVNIEYSYAYLTASENKACAVLRVSDNAHAEEVLGAHGIVTRMTKGGVEPAV